VKQKPEMRILANPSGGALVCEASTFHGEMIVLHNATEDLVIHCMKARKHELEKALRITGGSY
jgi:hypothetical protein